MNDLNSILARCAAATGKIQQGAVHLVTSGLIGFNQISKEDLKPLNSQVRKANTQ